MESRKCSIVEASAPSWIEQKRLAREFWHIQLFYDLKNNCKNLQCAESDLEKLRNADIEAFYETRPFTAEGNTVLTAALYLTETS